MRLAVNITDLVPRQLPQQPYPSPPRAPPGRQGAPPGGGGGGLKPAAVPSTFTTFVTSSSRSAISEPTVAPPITTSVPIATPIPAPPVMPTPTRETPGYNSTDSGFMVIPSTITTGALPSPTSQRNNNNGSVNIGAVVGGVCATLAVIAAAIGFWVYHRRKRNRTRAGYDAPSRPRYYDEKGPRQQLGSRLSSPTLSHYGDHNDYYHPSNTNTKNNCTGRGPQIFYPEAPATTGEMRSVPHTLPIDAAVYWPPPPGHAPPPPLPPPPFKSLSSSPTTSSPILYRDPGRNPQDHQKQEQLERALMLQRRQMQELRELQQRHIHENPLSCISAPHAPTLEDRQIWQQNDQEQRQLWLRQTGGNSGPVVDAAAAAAAIAGAGAGDVGGVSGSICAVRDPQYWGPSDNLSGGEVEGEKRREREEGSGESFTTTGTIKQQHQQEQDLRQYIAQMKEQYEEQFRRHQEELSRIRAEQESQLQVLRDQIKE